MKYERINKEDIKFIEIWEDCLRIKFIDNEVLDFNINKKGDQNKNDY